MERTGGCLCGAVRYELDHEIGPLFNCHCRFCRRAHGAAFVTSTAVPTRALRFTSGEEDLARHGGRWFCRRCATRLFNRLDTRPELTVLIVTSLDEEPSSAPVVHANCESKAPWYEILGDTPRFDDFPPAAKAMMAGRPVD